MTRRVMVLLVCLTCLQCGGGSPTGPTGGPSSPPDPFPSPPSPPPSGLPEVFVGAGDIALCDRNSEATAKLLDTIGGTVFTLGDNAYFHGSRDDFLNCYDPTWGRHRSRTRPSPGNHEYESPGAAPYFAYFGANAGPPGQGYYSFSVGDWHAVSLNSNVPAGGSSAQAAWLRNDLTANRSRCTIAYWHHPLFTSGPNGPSPEMREVWRILYDAGADVVLSGHDHLYERFAPQDPDGIPDPARGIREFVAGTGGASLYQVANVRPNSEVRFSGFGVLKLTLSSDRYQWEFIPVSGPSDRGEGLCH